MGIFKYDALPYEANIANNMIWGYSNMMHCFVKQILLIA
jgi:hypothetical protein